LSDAGVRKCPSCGEEVPERFRFCGYCGIALSARAERETRKTITVLFCDLKGSTLLGDSLDPEILRTIVARYFERVRGVIESHGGEIEKFIGDAVMAVFGLPQQREDDALRAVQCAAEMKRALVELNRDFARTWGITLTNRTGVNTGEIIVGDATRGERLVGDAINVAARLEAAAPSNEILLGPETYRLVRGTVEVEELEPLELKGKPEPVPAYRLASSIGAAALGEGERAPLVGREAELSALRAALDASATESACRVVTVLGEPGVGKTRLVEELGRLTGDRALMVEGRCLSYGRGITFWPLIEIVSQAAGIEDTDSPGEARSKLMELADGDSGVADRVAAAIGVDDSQFAVEETFLGIRRLFETLAAERPLVVVFQDLHWAEATLLDLIEHLSESAAGPILVVCPARPELDELRPELEERTGATRIELEGLSAPDVQVLIDELLGGGLGDDVRARIADAAGGNPLFVEQFISMMVDERLLRLEDGRWAPTASLEEITVPPTLQALLSARLDQLQPQELAVLEPASVIGMIFPRRALETLVADDVVAEVELRISSLAVKQLIREELSHAIAGESYRFGHAQIRESAYRRLLRRDRALLHERFVEWGEHTSRERGREAEFEEIIGYHLEQAYAYYCELGPLDSHARELGERAAERLTASGRRALSRGDMPAAANLLQRAAAVLPSRDPRRRELLPELAETLTDVAEFESAERYLDEAVEAGLEEQNDGLLARARLIRLHLESQSGESQDWADQVLTEGRRAAPIFEAAGDHQNLAMASRLVAWAHGTQCNYEKATDAADRAIQEASVAGDERQRRRAASQFAVASLYGPMPVDEGIRRCEEIVAEARGDRRTVGLVNSLMARMHAMLGDFDTARRKYVSARLTLEEMGRSVIASSTALDSCGVEMLAGDAPAAERELRRDFDALTDMGERYLLSTVAGELARAIYAQGRYDEAMGLTRTAEELSSDDDITSQGLWRLVRSKGLARQGQTREALNLASEALALLRQTDASVVRDEGLVDIAEAMRLCGKRDDARGLLREALAGFEAKGNVVSAENARTALRAFEHRGASRRSAETAGEPAERLSSP
jgi:class 3 adenylate cyclase/tetratricopeptide (TPR) repeat protein